MSVSCPKCREQVTLPAGVSPSARVECPLCSQVYHFEEVLDLLPPQLIVLDDVPDAGREEASAAEMVPAETLPLVDTGEQVPSMGFDNFEFETSPPPQLRSKRSIRGQRNARRKSPLLELSKIIAGGVVGLLIGQLILWWGLAKDPLRTAADVAAVAPWAVPPKFHAVPQVHDPQAAPLPQRSPRDRKSVPVSRDATATNAESASLPNQVAAVSPSAGYFGNEPGRAGSSRALPPPQLSTETVEPDADPVMGKQKQVDDSPSTLPVEAPSNFPERTDASVADLPSSTTVRSERLPFELPSEDDLPASRSETPSGEPDRIEASSDELGNQDEMQSEAPVTAAPKATLGRDPAAETPRAGVAAGEEQLRATSRDSVQPPVGGPGGPNAATKELVSRLTAAHQAAAKWKAAEPVDVAERRRLAAQFYRSLAGVGSALYNCPPGDPDLRRYRAGVRELLEEIAADDEQRSVVELAAPSWISAMGGGSGAIVFGEVHDVAAVGDWLRVHLKLRPGNQLTIFARPENAELEEGASVAVLGRLVEPEKPSIAPYATTTDTVLIECLTVSAAR